MDEGWHFGEGIPISISIIKKAIEIDKEIFNYGFLKTEAFPGTNGEIMVTIHYFDDYFEFIIENDETVTFLHEFKNKTLYSEENMSFINALHKISMLREHVWILSELLAENNTFLHNITESQAWHSTSDVTAVFPYWTVDASYKEIGLSASI